MLVGNDILTVTFIDNNAAPKMIDLTKPEEKAKYLQTKIFQANQFTKEECLNEVEENMDDENYTHEKPTALVDDMKEACHYAFQTPTKRSTSLVQSLKNISLTGMGSPKVSSTSNSNAVRTPTSSRKGCKKIGTPSTKPMKAQLQTPHLVRNQVKLRLKKIAEFANDDCSSESDEFEDSDEDENYDVSDSSTSDDDLENLCDVDFDVPTLKKTPHSTRASMVATTPKRKILGVKTPKTTNSCSSTKKRSQNIKEKEIDTKVMLDEYFLNADPLNCITSDHTLSRLEIPRLAPDALQSLLRGSHDRHLKEKKEMFSDLCMLFPQWATLLNEGFSIFLCGVGSKKQLLTSFQNVLFSSDHLVINGFFPSLTLRSIVSNIFQEILCLNAYPQSIGEQLRYLKSHYNGADAEPLFLVIHNLDGPMMRAHKMQHFLSQLASCRHIQLIASLDHINAPLLFEASKLSLYNPVWWDATTLSTYTEETSYENSLLVQQSGDLAFSSLIHVFKSLTPNAKSIFRILAKYQLQQKSNPNYTGLSLGDLYKMCRDAFLVSSDLTLRAQLTEFRDHKLIQTKKGFDGVENIFVVMDSATLQDFIDMEDA